jgi:hypothetical protein
MADPASIPAPAITGSPIPAQPLNQVPNPIRLTGSSSSSLRISVHIDTKPFTLLAPSHLFPTFIRSMKRDVYRSVVPQPILLSSFRSSSFNVHPTLSAYEITAGLPAMKEEHEILTLMGISCDTVSISLFSRNFGNIYPLCALSSIPGAPNSCYVQSNCMALLQRERPA